MRLRLVFLVSLIGTIVGSGVPIAILIGVYGSLARAADPGITHRVTAGKLLSLIPVIIGIAGGYFVYRHTARWRKLQATLTAGLIWLLCFLATVAAVWL